MTELATTPAPGALAPMSSFTSTAGTVQLQEWAAELSAAHALGTALCGTDFVPKDFRGKPDAAAAAILTGKSLGLDPMNALANIFVVQGRPALYARTMAALVMREGHEVIRTNAESGSVTVQARRRGQERWQEFTWTIERAKLAGYTSNKKYQSDPIGMLTAKALAEACRVIAPDVLTGVAAYSAEEIELDDMGEINQPTPAAPAAKPATRKVTRARAAAPAPTVPSVVNSAPEPADEPEENVDTETGELPDEGTPAALEVNYFDEITRLAGDKAGLRTLYGQAAAAGEPQDVLDAIASAGTAA
ncbi:hypothetical protein DQ353_00395 [Arthrobacter sp. AQ5-05]|uniref:hypothetical protein n=1 Tax=Arthrobacter sp. AQ5-05 TaxID=2184581 RepID=UPI000DCCD083|nr:hypothetical protein [Arthrobacter sp. AQ5-05]RAX50896.1 hypothetical protein DQ353_00395 [Arthrobacter sp. AQ5-05]